MASEPHQPHKGGSAQADAGVPPGHGHDDEEGQGMVEYAFILVLMVLVVILIFTVISKQTNNLYSNIENGIQGH